MSEPSASITAAVLWYRPAARFSKSDAMTTTLCFFASFANASVLGPGIGLGQLEEAVVLDLAEVLRAEQLLRADDLRPFFQGAFDQGQLTRDFFGSSPQAI